MLMPNFRSINFTGESDAIPDFTQAELWCKSVFFIPIPPRETSGGKTQPQLACQKYSILQQLTKGENFRPAGT